MLSENWKTYAAKQNGQNIRLNRGIEDVKNIQQNLITLWKRLNLNSDTEFKSFYNGLSYLGRRLQDAITSNNLLKEIVKQDNEGKLFDKEEHLNELSQTSKSKISHFNITENNVGEHAVKAIKQLFDLIDCGEYHSGFISIEEIIKNYLDFSLFIYDVGRYDFYEENILRLKEEIGKIGEKVLEANYCSSWEYSRYYEAFIESDYNPLEKSSQKDEYGYLLSQAKEKISYKDSVIEELHNYIEDLKIQLATDRECLVITSEEDLENYFVMCCEKLGWKCEKQQPKIEGKGVPDRLVIGNNLNQRKYVELKLPKGDLSMEQKEYHKDLYRNKGLIADVIDTKEKVDKLIKKLADAEGAWDEVTVDNIVAIDKI